MILNSRKTQKEENLPALRETLLLLVGRSHREFWDAKEQPPIYNRLGWPYISRQAFSHADEILTDSLKILNIILGGYELELR